MVFDFGKLGGQKHRGYFYWIHFLRPGLWSDRRKRSIAPWQPFLCYWPCYYHSFAGRIFGFMLWTRLFISISTNTYLKPGFWICWYFISKLKSSVFNKFFKILEWKLNYSSGYKRYYNTAICQNQEQWRDPSYKKCYTRWFSFWSCPATTWRGKIA